MNLIQTVYVRFKLVSHANAAKQSRTVLKEANDVVDGVGDSSEVNFYCHLRITQTSDEDNTLRVYLSGTGFQAALR